MANVKKKRKYKKWMFLIVNFTRREWRRSTIIIIVVGDSLFIDVARITKSPRGDKSNYRTRKKENEARRLLTKPYAEIGAIRTSQSGFDAAKSDLHSQQ